MDAIDLYTRLFSQRPLGEDGGWEIAEFGVPSLTVAEDFEVLGNVGLGFLPRGVTPVVDFSVPPIFLRLRLPYASTST